MVTSQPLYRCAIELLHRSYYFVVILYSKLNFNQILIHPVNVIFSVCVLLCSAVKCPNRKRVKLGAGN